MRDPYLWSQFDGHPLRVDPEGDMGYIKVREGEFKRNDLADKPQGIIADYDARGCLLGIEIFLRDGKVRPESAAVIRRLLGAETPSEEQWAILSVVQRLEQIAQEGESPLAALLWHRVLTCDVPRLRGLLSPETLQWAD